MEIESPDAKPKSKSGFFNTLREKRRSIKFSISPFSHKNQQAAPIDEKRIAELLRERSKSAPITPISLREDPVAKADLDDIWNDIFNNWDEWQKENKRYELVEIICKRGVPDARRGEAWNRLSKLIPGAHLIKCAKERTGAEHTCIYQHLLTLETHHEAQIRNDLHRTILGDHLGELSESMREALYRVLKAYSLYDEGVGYCQGMNFVAGLLLLKLTEEDAFYVLARIMKGQGLRSFYTEDMTGAKLRMHQMTLLVRHLFPDMYKHLNELELDVAMVTLPWFLTAFAYQLPLQVSLSVLDLIIIEGIPALFRVGLAILVLCENDVMCLDTKNVSDYFRVDLQRRIKNSPSVMNTAFSVNVSTSQLSQMEEKYLSHSPSSQTSSTSSLPSPTDDNSPRHSLHSLLVDNYDLKAKLKLQTRDCESWKKKYEEETQARQKEQAENSSKLTELMLEIAALKMDKYKLNEQLSSSGADGVQKSLSQMIDCNLALTQELVELKKQVRLGSSTVQVV